MFSATFSRINIEFLAQANLPHDGAIRNLFTSKHRIGGLTAALGLRKQGHKVTLLERSGLNSEVGAAIHLAPNCHGILKQFDIFPEKFGANPIRGIADYDAIGNQRVRVDLRKPLSIWQHWRLPTSLPGRPAEIRTNCSVADVDPTGGTVTLEDGFVVSGDLIIGADGVSSVTRSIIAGPSLKPFGSGKSAFRFMIPRSTLRENPETRDLVAEDGYLTMWVGDDRRLVMYPTLNNTVMNFVGIHPSELTSGQGKGWSRSGSKERLLEVYGGFAPVVLSILREVDESELKVWTLLDMDRIPTWIKGKLALLGDAAHPFLAHQGQGGAMAIEDAAALAALLPSGTTVDELPERLALYEKIRDARAHKIQSFTRSAGEDLTDANRKNFNMMEFINYNFGHDEWHNSRRVLQEHLWSRNGPSFQRGPLSFGPMPSPRQRHDGTPQPPGGSTTAHNIRFSTSATYLKTLFPTPAFSFVGHGTLAEASLVTLEFRDLSWLGGRGYNVCGFFIHGVRYEKEPGNSVIGSFMAVMFEGAADPLVTGREELGVPKIFCNIDVAKKEKCVLVKCSWDGNVFIEIDLGAGSPTNGAATNGVSKPEDQDAQTQTNGALQPVQDAPTWFWYRCVPSVGKKGVADAEYLVTQTHEPVPDSTSPDAAAKKTWHESTMKFDRGTWKTLPTLHHVASTLADMPVYGVIASDTTERENLTSPFIHYACKYKQTLL
ncbi:3-hydroxybenzoate 6-hydroxylase 1 like protein [Verticillium longisporum]|uniref:3-hydroxybenzoate 6-hydroxylase 1 like protein n=1 Tax=Verticillium longisporum TaxID=100787 RepID=A0A8I2ZME8_VERLO|nr:3-hydroxybenzoate 6-hydroxylase 1 like protein [Verticillium longisporum]